MVMKRVKPIGASSRTVATFSAFLPRCCFQACLLARHGRRPTFADGMIRKYLAAETKRISEKSWTALPRPVEKVNRG